MCVCVWVSVCVGVCVCVCAMGTCVYRYVYLVPRFVVHLLLHNEVCITALGRCVGVHMGVRCMCSRAYGC